jgi:cytoskeletal protein CcmA (bactofilin family)
LLNGTVKGDVDASQRVELGSKARVVGNVQYKLIEMAIGAEVNGKLIHTSESIRLEPNRAEASGNELAGVVSVAKVNVAGE